jgi:hypothetical protein
VVEFAEFVAFRGLAYGRQKRRTKLRRVVGDVARMRGGRVGDVAGVVTVRMLGKLTFLPLAIVK